MTELKNPRSSSSRSGSRTSPTCPGARVDRRRRRVRQVGVDRQRQLLDEQAVALLRLLPCPNEPGILDRHADARRQRREQARVVVAEPARLGGALHADDTDRLVAGQDRDAQPGLGLRPDAARPDLFELLVGVEHQRLAGLEDARGEAFAKLERRPASRGGRPRCSTGNSIIRVASSSRATYTMSARNTLRICSPTSSINESRSSWRARALPMRLTVSSSAARASASSRRRFVSSNSRALSRATPMFVASVESRRSCSSPYACRSPVPIAITPMALSPAGIGTPRYELVPSTLNGAPMALASVGRSRPGSAGRISGSAP